VVLLYLISDRAALEPDGADRLVELVADAARAGVDLVQIRERDLSARDLTALARRVVDAARPARVLVNDRFDVALAAGAAGVHLATTSLAPAVVRACVGQRMIVGVSTHALEEVRLAEEGGADFAVFGPVYDTPSKRGLGTPPGVEGLAAAAAVSRLPLLALGGVDATSADRAREAGAAGLAGIRVFHEPWLRGGYPALVEVVRALRRTE
jgi:thiamine-phosphate pyrophosphorylase